MAHGDESRKRVRSAFVFEQMDLTLAALQANIPIGTARRWKAEAKAAGDDWDKAKAAQTLADDMEGTSRQMLAAMVLQVSAALDSMQTNAELSAVEKVKMLASLADSSHKLMATMKRSMPETDKLGVAMDVVKKLLDFTRIQYPQHVGAIAELLTPFGEELTKAYGS